MLAVYETTPLPDDAVVVHVILIPYRGEKPVVAWKDNRYWLPEGDTREGESADDAIKRVALEQAGIQDPKADHLGHFRIRHTSFSKTPGAITYSVLYAVEVGSLADFPSDPAWERRIILQRELNNLLRTSYVELRREYTDSLDPWLLERLKANLRG